MTSSTVEFDCESLPALLIRSLMRRRLVLTCLVDCVQSYEEFESIYSRASAHRKTSATGLNNVSSRSHAVLMIKVSSML